MGKKSHAPGFSSEETLTMGLTLKEVHSLAYLKGRGYKNNTALMLQPSWLLVAPWGLPVLFSTAYHATLFF